MIKQILLFLILCSISASGVSQNTKIRRPIPREVPNNQVEFAMSLAEFRDNFKRDDITLDDSYGFRQVYTQKVKNRHVSEIIYYFDSDGDQPLYEIIVVYKEEEMAELIAARKYGAPNFREHEWRFTYKEHDIWCWVYKNKIVVAAKIPDTEWFAEW